MTIPQARTADQALRDTLALLPDGFASTHSADDYLGARFRPAADAFAAIEASVLSMLPQIDPRAAPNLLPDWERMLGPDPCQVTAGITDTVTLGEFAYERLVNSGTICAGYFERLALSIGETITITEFPPSECGSAICGTTRLNPEPGSSAFLVTLPTQTVAKAICGVSTCGDLLGSFDHSIMECVIRNQAPLYATPFFSYTG
jgi:uncharacterized protein YmfQ (DUF2313 family)